MQLVRFEIQYRWLNCPLKCGNLSLAVLQNSFVDAVKRNAIVSPMDLDDGRLQDLEVMEKGADPSWRIFDGLSELHYFLDAFC